MPVLSLLHRTLPVCLSFKVQLNLAAFLWIFLLGVPDCWQHHVLHLCVRVLTLPPNREPLEGEAWVPGVYVLRMSQQKVNPISQRFVIPQVGGRTNG